MKILILGIDKENAVAVSNIMANIFLLFSKEHSDFSFTSVGWGPKDEHAFNNANFESYYFKNPLKTFCNKAVRKIQRALKIDCPLFTWKKLFNKTKRMIDCIQYDIFIGASGHFLYIKTAFELAKHYSKRFIPIYFDPFTKNFLSTNYKRRKKEELKWAELSDFIFYDADATLPEFDEFNSKKIPFFIPIFPKNETKSTDNKIVYGGIFYKGFRGPEPFEKFLEKNSESTYRFLVYSNLKKLRKHFNNCTLYPMQNYETYSRICEDAAALIVIGNGRQTDIFPSKLLEAFSFKKPVILINFDNPYNL